MDSTVPCHEDAERLRRRKSRFSRFLPAAELQTRDRACVYLAALDSLRRGQQFPPKGLPKLVGCLKRCTSVITVAPPNEVISRLAPLFSNKAIEAALGRCLPHVKRLQQSRNAAVMLGSPEDGTAAAELLGSFTLGDLTTKGLDHVFCKILVACTTVDPRELADELVGHGWVTFSGGDSSVGAVIVPEGSPPAELKDRQTQVQAALAKWCRMPDGDLEEAKGKRQLEGPTGRRFGGGRRCKKRPRG